MAMVLQHSAAPRSFRPRLPWRCLPDVLRVPRGWQGILRVHSRRNVRSLRRLSRRPRPARPNCSGRASNDLGRSRRDGSRPIADRRSLC